MVASHFQAPFLGVKKQELGMRLQYYDSKYMYIGILYSRCGVSAHNFSILTRVSSPQVSSL